MKMARKWELMLALGVAAGCGDESGGSVCSSYTGPGELVIVELMADPMGEDEGFEWVEIYNPTALTQCLNGLHIEASGGVIRQYFIRSDESLEVPPGSHALLGGAFVDGTLATWESDFRVNNSSGVLSLKSGNVLIDSVVFGSDGNPVVEGKSNELCGECRDAVCNDDAERWGGPTTAKYDAGGNVGSPGSPNPECVCPVPAGVSALRAPKPGDLLITEVYANPTGTDGDREWFEVRVVAQDSGIDFSNVGIVAEKGKAPSATVERALCLTAPPGALVVFGRSYDSASNGGIQVHYSYGQKITLPNAGGYVGLSLDGNILASATFGPTSDGRALQYDETSHEWCDATSPFGDHGGYGTPGTVNPGCGQATCADGKKTILASTPNPGELEINELFPKAPKSDESLEWFELRVAGAREIHLNRLEVWQDTKAVKPVFVIEPQGGACISVQPGGLVVLTRSQTPDKAGLPPGSVIFQYQGLDLADAGYLGIHYQGKVIDSTTWGASAEGMSSQKDPLTGEWCPGAQKYWTTPSGTPCFGTPGAPNSPCAASVTCLDGGSSRPAILPVPGELLFAEIFANPTSNDSPDREWLEIHAKESAIGKDLNGLELYVKGESKGKFGDGSEECVSISKSELVVGRTGSAAENGGVEVDVVLPKLSLPNSDVGLQLAAGNQVYDFLFYEGPGDGVAMQLDPAYLTVEANDLPEHWCDAKGPFNDAGELGSPGKPNPSCSASFCVNQGIAEEVKAPFPNEVVITEIFCNTPGNEDANREWFEVWIPPEANIAHLNGVGVMKKGGEKPAYIFQATQCIELVPGQTYVLCRNADPAKNGGLKDCIPYDSVTLNNDYGFLGLGLPGVLYDAVPDYGKSKDGISRSLDQGHYSATDNDSSSNWCSTPAGNTFGDGQGTGTPGKKNPKCL